MLGRYRKHGKQSLPCPALIGKRQSGGGFWQLFSFLSHNVTNNILNPSLILVGVIATVLPLFSFSLILGYIGLATDSFFSSKTKLKLSFQCDGIGGVEISKRPYDKVGVLRN